MCASPSTARWRCRARSSSSIRCTIWPSCPTIRSLIGDTPVRAATFVTKELRPGDDVWVVGQRSDSKIMSERTQVASVDPVAFPLSRTLRFRDSNLEAINLVNAPADLDGVIADDKGDVLALWSSFAFETQRELEQVNRGIPADLVTEMINAVVQRATAVFVRGGVQCAVARRRAQARVDRRLGASASRNTIGSVGRCSASTGWSRARPRRRCSSRAICCSPSTARSSIGSAKWSAPCRSRKWRSRSGATAPRRRCKMKTVALNGRDIDRVLIWAGATLQAPHRAMAAQRGIAPYGRVRVVLLLRLAGDSLRPVCRAGASSRSTGSRLADLDAFIKAVRGKPDRASLRLKTISWNGMTDVITLKLDKHYWPAYELDRESDGSWTAYRARSRT